MQIEEYIVELLSEHECVVIPGLGGFVKKSSKANHATMIDQWSPPYTSITFNTKLKENDGLLIQTICQRENKSFALVKQEVSKYVSYLQSSLQAKETIMLPHIGFLFLESSMIRFVALHSKSGTLDDKIYFGLPSFSLQRITPENTVDSYTTTTTFQTLRNYAAIFILFINVVLLFTLFSPLRYPIEQASLSIFSNQEPIQYKSRSTSSINYSTAELSQAFDLLNEVDVLLKSKPESIKTPQNNTIQPIQLPYKLIIGCFKNEENAQKSLAALSAEFVEPFYFYHQGLYKVCVFSSLQKDSVLQKKIEFEKKTGIQTWILNSASPNS